MYVDETGAGEMKDKLEIVGAVAAIVVIVGGFWGGVAYLVL